MIDDYARAMDLLHKMEDQLPIPVRLGSPVKRTLQEKGLAVTRNHKSGIKRVFYFGDEGGIMCDVTPAKDAKEAVVVFPHPPIGPGTPSAGTGDPSLPAGAGSPACPIRWTGRIL
jgi:hypothetical protein